MSVRDAEQADIPAILELLKVSLGEGRIPRRADYWHWKHVQNPFGPSPILLAEEEGQLVGLRAFMRWEWRLGGTAVSAVRAVDTATHPRWQGRGIFSKLTRALVERMRAEGVHLIFNTPNEKSRPGYLKMGWEQVGRVDLWIRPSPVRLIRALPRRGKGADDVGPFLPLDPPFSTIGDLCRSAEVETFLSQTCPDERRLRTPWTSEYLLWRYGSIPGFAYASLADLSGSEGAIIVFRAKQGAIGRELRICELIVGRGKASGEVATRLLRRMHRNIPAEYVSAIAPPRSAERAALRRVGFLPTFGVGPLLTVNQLDVLPRGLDPRSMNGWRLSIGDLELF